MELFTGKENFLSHGSPTGLTMQDFWQFQYSNVYDMQEYIAEFLVAKALGLEKPFNRDGWTLWDIDYRGRRIEVKETGYYHSWRKDGKVSKQRTFGISQAYSVDESGERVKDKNGNDIKERQNDYYVFCLNIGEDREGSNPLELSHWEFYVVPTKILNEVCGNNQSINLNRVRSLAKRIVFEDIKIALDTLINSEQA
jgi:hypothetical protein